MKKIILVTMLFAGMAQAGSKGSTYSSKPAKIGEKTYSCLNAGKAALINDFAEEISNREEVEFYIEFLRDNLVEACQHRDNPDRESFVWSDGNRMSGTSLIKNDDGCLVEETWVGQDDQDAEEGDRNDCL